MRNFMYYFPHSVWRRQWCFYVIKTYMILNLLDDLEQFLVRV